MNNITNNKLNHKVCQINKILLLRVQYNMNISLQYAKRWPVPLPTRGTMTVYGVLLTRAFIRSKCSIKQLVSGTRNLGRTSISKVTEPSKRVWRNNITQLVSTVKRFQKKDFLIKLKPGKKEGEESRGQEDKTRKKEIRQVDLMPRHKHTYTMAHSSPAISVAVSVSSPASSSSC